MGGGGKSYLNRPVDNERKIIVDNIKLPVLKRKYDVDVQGLQELLRTRKKETGLSNKDIAAVLGLPLTNVAHWFRTDKHFSIPAANVWFDLKEVLGIVDDSFDESILSFVEVDGKYDMSNRLYSDEGLAPTLKCNNKGELIKEHKRRVNQVNNYRKTYQDGRVYSADGLSIALNARGNNGWYTEDDRTEQQIRKQFAKK